MTIKKNDYSDLPIDIHIKAFCDANKAALEFAKEKIIPILFTQIQLQEKRESAIAGLYCRMYALMSSLVLMRTPIHFQTTASIARSLFELMLDLKILANDKTTKLAEKFEAFTIIEKYYVARNIISFYDTNPKYPKPNLSPMQDFTKKTLKKTLIILL